MEAGVDVEAGGGVVVAVLARGKEDEGVAVDQTPGKEKVAETEGHDDAINAEKNPTSLSIVHIRKSKLPNSRSSLKRRSNSEETASVHKLQLQ